VSRLWEIARGRVEDGTGGMDRGKGNSAVCKETG